MTSDVLPGDAANAQLEDERDFLLRSIEDLDAELAVGDISPSDHAALRDRYTARAAEVIHALNGQSLPTAKSAGTTDHKGREAVTDLAPAAQRRRRARRVLVIGALACFATAAAVLVVAEVSKRLPGETATGTISLSRAQEIARTLEQAQALESEGNGSAALTLYRQVLAEDPTNQQALAESGWLEFQAGVQAHDSTLIADGQRQEQTAEAEAPSAYAPHLYLGSMFLVEGQSVASANEFATFLADDPPVSAVQPAWPFVVKAYTQAGRTPPAPPPGVKG